MGTAASDPKGGDQGHVAVGRALWPPLVTRDLTEERRGGIIQSVYRAPYATLSAMLEHAAERRPDRVALAEIGVRDERRLTYAEFDRQVRRLARAFRDRLGVQPGDRVGLFMVNGIPFCLTFFAVARLGAIAVPLNTKYRGTELTATVKDAGVRLLVMNPNWLETARAVIEQDYVRNVVVTRPAVIPSQSDRTVPALVPPRSVNFDDLIGDDEAEDRDESPARERDTVLLMYTSGTTGHAKGAELSHRNVVQAVSTYEHVLGLGSDERTVVAVPLYHATGLIAQFLLTVHVAGTTAVLPTFDSTRLVHALERERMTFFHAAPTVYIMMLRDPGHTSVRVDHWRVAVSGGAAMPLEMIGRLRQWVPHLRFHTAWGMTEATSPGTVMPPLSWEAWQKRLGSSGWPSPTNECCVVDAEGSVLAPDAPGELLVRGPMVAKGYWQNPEATAQAFAAGWLHTGDIARIDAEGYVYILDRIKDMINRGGEKVYSIEVENALHNHPAILEAAVVGMPDPVYGERVKAVVVRAPGTRLSEEDVRSWVRERLAGFKVPAAVEFVDALPRNAGGKVRKGLLRGLDRTSRS